MCPRDNRGFEKQISTKLYYTATLNNELKLRNKEEIKKIKIIITDKCHQQ